jgi:predicted NUDIX family NTP pyrophosphohydrolase
MSTQGIAPPIDRPQLPRDPAMASSAPLSAGILLYRVDGGDVRVLLGHPGGPYFGKKDAGVWTIPKGLLATDELPEVAALREFEEELGWRPSGRLDELGEIKMKSGKRVLAFALRDDAPEASQLARFRPGTFSLEWPPRSGRRQEFPEIDRIEFFPLAVARDKILPAQAPLLDRLADRISNQRESP